MSRISIRLASGGSSQTTRPPTCSRSRAPPAAASGCSCARPTSPRSRARTTAWGSRAPGHWLEALNTDSARYGGSNVENPNGIHAEAIPWHGQESSGEVTLPPLGVIWLVPSSSDQ